MDKETYYNIVSDLIINDLLNSKTIDSNDLKILKKLENNKKN